jgi:Domain of unknown function (DUF5666)
MQRFSAVLLAISLVLLTANASAAESNVCNAGIGGTGIQQDGIGGTGNQSEGIGGTGIQASSGVGGTGAQANSGVGGTGIVGVITGFASICVNGLEVHYDTQTHVDMDGVSSSIDALNIGQLVAIESSNKGSQLKAQRVSVSHIMVGKIEKVSAAQKTVQVMGQTISLSSNTIGGADLKINQIVKVSGLVSANNLVHALRIDLAAANTPSSITGLIDQNGKINGVDIASSNQSHTGRAVQVSGQWDGRSLHAERIKESATQRVLKGAENLVIQGIAPAHAVQQFSMQNHIINIDANTKITGANAGSNQTIIVRGKLDRAGNITARTIEYSNQDKVLERGGSKHRPSASDKSSSNNSDEDRNAGEKIETKERTEKAESAERHESTERLEKAERAEHTERPEKVERAEHVERPERAERHEAHEH